MKMILAILSTLSATLFPCLIYSGFDFYDYTMFSRPPTITAAEIQTLLNGSARDQVVVVDVRSPAETAVSMIPGAVTQQVFEQSIDEHRDKTVVVYCTIGYRSKNYASKLRGDGIDAFNYAGSILDWCENQFEVVTPDGQKTRRVHTYSSRYRLAQGYQAVY